MSINDPYILANAIIGFDDMVEAAGVDVASLLKEADIAAIALIEPGTLISYKKFSICMKSRQMPATGPIWELRWPSIHRPTCP